MEQHDLYQAHSEAPPRPDIKLYKISVTEVIVCGWANGRTEVIVSSRSVANTPKLCNMFFRLRVTFCRLGAAVGSCPWIFRGGDHGLYIAPHIEAQQGRERFLCDNRAGNHGRELQECTSIKENGKEI